MHREERLSPSVGSVLGFLHKLKKCVSWPPCCSVFLSRIHASMLRCVQQGLILKALFTCDIPDSSTACDTVALKDPEVKSQVLFGLPSFSQSFHVEALKSSPLGRTGLGPTILQLRDHKPNGNGFSPSCSISQLISSDNLRLRPWIRHSVPSHNWNTEGERTASIDDAKNVKYGFGSETCRSTLNEHSQL